MSSKNNKKTKKSRTESLIKLYSFFHLALIVYSVIVSYKCNGGLNVVQTGLAIMCPHLYLIYIAATKGLTFCLLGVIGSNEEGEGEEE
jgi:hypothetical protein